jgi:lipoyl(octanoyl) transferase
VKTSLMLGLGETDAEILETMRDLRAAGVDLLTLGQYLRPTVNHLAVERFVSPEEFDRIGSRRWNSASSNAFRARWCVRATAPSRRSPATMRASRRAVWRCGVETRDRATMAVTQSPAQPLLQWLGRVDYEPTWRAMQNRTDAATRATPDEIWFLEHPPVFTQGMNGNARAPARAGRHPGGCDRSRRAGDLSRAGPARRLPVARPVAARTRRACAGGRHRARGDRHAGEWGIVAYGRRDAPGVYVDGRKIASVGLRIRRGRSYHGLALNVAMDLEPFARINPCGYAGLQMTQVSALGGPSGVREVGERLAPNLLRARLHARGPARGGASRATIRARRAPGCRT